MNGKITVSDLRCEYLSNPIGIDVKKPAISWKLQSGERNIMQTAYRLQVTENDIEFKNVLWDSEKVVSDQSAHVAYGGKALQSRTRYYFRVKIWDRSGYESDWSETALWEMGILESSEWTAEWITYDTPNPYLRKTFKIGKNIKAARIYATALGLYELHLNGSRVGNDYLTPGWTSYEKRLQYQTYDVSEMLKNGENAVGAIIGNGWYKGDLGFEMRNNIYGDKSALLLQMHITYEDGREETIISDDSWKASSSPILMSEIYHGETYDARLEKAGWSSSEYDDRDWSRVSLLEHTKSHLVAQENEPVKIVEEIKPVEIIHTPKGETVIDFGQNMVGWVRLTVEGHEGEEVIIRHAEVLDKDGNFYTDNIRNAKQTIRYILKGSSIETFEPHFTFQCFRYIKLEKYPAKPELASFTGMVLHSGMQHIGEFRCSDALVNQLQHNILWGMKGNFVDVPTDCPQRDERLGWTGDAQVFSRTACFNMNTSVFFRKWLRDLKADQRTNGSMPHVIPNILHDAKFGSTSACGWGDAAVIVPWTVYLAYGDIRILEEQYESMKAYVENIRSCAEDGVLWNTGFHFGDWVALDAKEGSYFGATPNDLTATAFYAYSTSILAKSAALLNKNEDAGQYGKLHTDIVKAFRKEFFTPNGRLAAPTQTAHILALIFDLVEEKDRKRTIDTLVKYLEKNQWHLTTGFLGTPYLCDALSRNNRLDVAYKLLLQTDYPSWLYQITKGATTIWEHWDGIKEDGSFWSADMNSFNHYAYGSIGDWLYRVVAGINTDEAKPGYKRIIFKPQPCKEIQWASAGFESMYGLIKIYWSINGGQMQIDVTVPANTTAALVLPSCVTGEASEISLGSGAYSLSYPINANLLPTVPPTLERNPWEP